MRGELPFRLYVISDRTRMGPAPLDALEEVSRLKGCAVQWREKDLETPEQLRALTDVCGRIDDLTRLFVNGRLDLALAFGIGLHLPDVGVPTTAARCALGATGYIGRSTHSLLGALRAEEQGADFITFGPIFPTASKRAYGEPRGLEALHEICAAVELPVFALGGVTEERVDDCVAAGAFGIAAISAIWVAEVPIAAATRLTERLAQHPAQHLAR